MEDKIWILWMILAAAFVVGEMFTAGFFLMWFGIGAAAAGLVALIGASGIWQVVVFIVVSGVLFAFSRRLADRVSTQQPPGIGADRFVGKQGVVLEEVDNIKNTGRVRIGNDEWRAISETGTPIGAETVIMVSRVDGTRVVVKQVEE